jgi:phage shock protein B
MEGFVAIVAIFIALPWIIFHYITKWKSQGSLTTEDENLMDELHEMARRLDDRVATIERIMTAENPGWRQMAADPASIGIEDNSIARRMGNERP